MAQCPNCADWYFRKERVRRIGHPLSDGKAPGHSHDSSTAVIQRLHVPILEPCSACLIKADVKIPQFIKCGNPDCWLAEANYARCFPEGGAQLQPRILGVATAVSANTVAYGIARDVMSGFVKDATMKCAANAEIALCAPDASAKQEERAVPS